jgi:hypothetical protein
MLDVERACRLLEKHIANAGNTLVQDLAIGRITIAGTD